MRVLLCSSLFSERIIKKVTKILWYIDHVKTGSIHIIRAVYISRETQMAIRRCCCFFSLLFHLMHALKVYDRNKRRFFNLQTRTNIRHLENGMSESKNKDTCFILQWNICSNFSSPACRFVSLLRFVSQSSGFDFLHSITAFLSLPLSVSANEIWDFLLTTECHSCPLRIHCSA